MSDLTRQPRAWRPACLGSSDENDFKRFRHSGTSWCRIISTPDHYYIISQSKSIYKVYVASIYGPNFPIWRNVCKFHYSYCPPTSVIDTSPSPFGPFPISVIPLTISFAFAAVSACSFSFSLREERTNALIWGKKIFKTSTTFVGPSVVIIWLPDRLRARSSSNIAWERGT